MIRSHGPKRTWMKITGPHGFVFWVAIEHDSIVARRDADEGTVELKPEHRLRADDTLSMWVRKGDKVEGPFNAPE